jgi:hypothetical protein
LGEWRGEVVVDTYAILAMAYGELGVNAERAMLGIKRGEISGYYTRNRSLRARATLVEE